jgi:hypothetical protein
MKKVGATILILASLLAYAIPAQAAPLVQDTILDKVLWVFVQFASLAGIGAVIAAVVNFGKTLGWIKDSVAGRWFAGLNLVAIFGLIYLKIFQPQIAIEYVDAQAAVLAQILVIVLGYIVQLVSGQTAHNTFANLRIPVIGKSFSREKA